jgi:NAD(P)-dependent dehydrogenase (short-subunit alcohol dehydrogenase family)
VDVVIERWGRIDVLVNSAGHGPRAPILDITDENWHRGLDTYLMNVIRPTRLVTPVMQKQKSGVIINISTARAFEPSAMFPTSAVFRSGLAAFAKIFADTYAGDNVRMNNVLPGWIDSLPATEERRQSVPLQALWHEPGNCRDDRIPRLGGSRLYHRPEHPGRWRNHAGGVRRGRPVHLAGRE